MRIVVIGDGKVGRTIVQNLCQEGHDVTVIDNNPTNIEQIIEQFDVMAVCGNGASYDIQKSAGVSKAALVIAVTSTDETNILSCLIAQKLGVKSTIARVRSYEYINQLNILRNDLGITMIINPEAEAANEITKILNFPEAIRVDSFAKGFVDLVEIYIPSNSQLVGESLISIAIKYQLKVLICAIQRDGEVIIPNGNTVIQAEDKIHITASSKFVLKEFINKTGLSEDKIKDIMIIGGGKISAYLAKNLIGNKFNVKIIEQDYKKCEELSQLLPKANIIHGDGSDQIILSEEGLDNTDSIICLTGNDEENIIISMYAHAHNVKKIITKINKDSFVGLMKTISMSSIISPKNITSSKIVSYVRAKNNSRGSNVKTLYKLVNNKVEALEFNAKEKTKLDGIPLKDLKLKKNILIASIIRNGEVIIPSGSDTILPNDSVVVVTTNQFLDDLEDILE